MKKRRPKAPEPDILAKWANVPKFAGRYRVKPGAACGQKGSQPQEEPKVSTLPGRYVVGVGVKQEPKHYTGTKMIGVGQMHKSNAVPVFSQDEAIDIATMRRN